VTPLLLYRRKSCRFQISILSLLHAGVCYNLLASQVLLKGSRKMEDTGREV